MQLFSISLHVKDGLLQSTLMYHVLLHLHLLSPGKIGTQYFNSRAGGVCRTGRGVGRDRAPFIFPVPIPFTVAFNGTLRLD